ncbi:hypothetical protein ACF05T_28635 [Streptomyces lateritius]|uniref:Uncharacterized protein n=1 Tax=Streptomyces lateritius TaxID=67313 RepID=A0ABW6YJI9_9ACTN
MDAESFLANAFARSLGERWKELQHLQTHGSDLDEGAVQVIAEDAAAAAVSNLSWHIALGECITAQAMAARLGVPVSVIVEAVSNGRLVGLAGRFETFLPLWQFHDQVPDKGPISVITDVLEEFSGGLGSAFSPELVVLWGATEQPELNDQEPRAVLSKVAPEKLVWSAKVTVAGLAR